MQTPTIPEGYIIGTTDEGHQYLVPQFVVPASHEAFDAYKKKVDLNVWTTPGGVRVPHFIRAGAIPSRSAIVNYSIHY